jgi:hypothetical protein
MKIIFALTLLAIASPVLAADFPTGTFVCKKHLDDGSVIFMSTVLVSEIDLGGVSLPLLEIKYENTRYVDHPSTTLKGIASLVERNGAKQLSVAGLGPTKSIYFSKAGSIYDPSYGSLCTKQ